MVKYAMQEYLACIENERQKIALPRHYITAKGNLKGTTRLDGIFVQAIFFHRSFDYLQGKREHKFRDHINLGQVLHS